MLGCAGLLWLNLAYLRTPAASEPQTIAKVVQSGLNLALPPELTFNPPPLRRFTETLERPLFNPTRRPPEVKIVTAKPAPKAPLNLILKGVIYSPEERIAIVAPKAKKRGQTILRLSEGATYEGWTLEEITPKAATFRHGDAEEHLKLLFDEAPKIQRRSRSKRKKRRSNG